MSKALDRDIARMSKKMPRLLSPGEQDRAKFEDIRKSKKTALQAGMELHKSDNHDPGDPWDS